MKSIRLIILVLIFILSYSSSRSQWTPCQGIEGINCYSITYQDSGIFITGGGGTFRRPVNADSWDTACFNFSARKIRSTGSALFCYGGEVMSQFYRSLDNGITWEDVSDLAGDYDEMETIDSVIFLVVDGGKLLTSIGNGDTWTEIHPAGIQANAAGIYTQPGILFCFLEDIDTLFRSDDYGISWIKYPITGVIGAGCPYLDDGNLWLVQDNNFYIFNDTGQEWIMQSDSMPVGVFASRIIEDGSSIGCITYDGYYYFDVQDSTWLDRSQGLELRTIWDECRIGSSIYLATKSGPFSKSGDKDWASQYNDLFGEAVFKVFAFGGKTYALAKENIYCSGDIETGFVPVESLGYCNPYDMIVDGEVWCESSHCGFAISADTGKTWTDFSAGLEELIMNIAATSDYYYAASYRNEGLFRSLKMNDSWERVPNDLGTMYISDLETLNNVLFAVSDYTLYRSFDSGTTFDVLNDAGNGNYLYVSNDKIFFQRDYDIVFSADSGNTWQTWIDQINAIQYSMDVSDPGDKTVVGGYFGPWNPVNYLEIFTAEDPYGTDITDDLPPYLWSSINFVWIDNERLYVCPSSGGLWYRDDLIVGMEEDPPASSPSSQILFYPNPANAFLNIHFDKTSKQFEFRVIDFSGKIMMKGIIDGSADHSVDISLLPAGIYLMVLKDTNGHVSSEKFMIIR